MNFSTIFVILSVAAIFYAAAQNVIDRKKKVARIISDAQRDYVRAKDALKAWRAYPGDENLRMRAESAAEFYRSIRINAELLEQPKWRDEVLQRHFYRECARLVAVDRDFARGDREFLAALVELESFCCQK